MRQTDASTQHTLAYYDANAASFSAATIGVEFNNMRQRFTHLLKPGAHIHHQGDPIGGPVAGYEDDLAALSIWA